MIPRLNSYQYNQRRITPLSPVGLALFSYSFFIVSTLIPPSTYESILLEQNKMFLNPVVHLFVAACVVSFVSGTTIGRKFRFVSRRRHRLPLSRSAIIIPVLLAAAINLLSLTILLKNNPNLLTAWLMNAAAAKEELDTAGALSEALPLLFGVLWWSFWRLLEKESLTGKREWTLRLVVGLAFMFAVATSVIKVARYDLMPGVIGFILIYGIYKYKNSSVPIRKYILPLAQVGALIISLFVVISWLRGASNSSDIINNILGYTVASYNRLAAALDGDLRFPFGGTGTYAFRFLDHIPLLHRWLDISEILGTPSSESVWLSEFTAVHQAGLDGRYIWLSSFGYLYLDLGLFIFFYLFIVGMLMGWLWKNIIDGVSTGIVIYPWFAFSVLFWFGSNFLAYPRLITFVGAALLLSMYEWMFRIVMKKNAAKPIVNRQLWQERLQ